MDNDLSNRNFVVATLITSRRNIGVFSLAALSTLTLDLVSRFVDTNVGIGFFLMISISLTESIIGCYLSIAAHSTVLKGISGFKSIADQRVVGRYLGRAVALALIYMSISIGGAVLIIGLLIIGGNTELCFIFTDVELGFILIAAGLLWTPTSWIVFGLLGTMLSAIVAEGDYSLTRAIQRGRKTFFYSTGRIIIGPGLLFFATIVTAQEFPMYNEAGALLLVEQGIEFWNVAPLAMVHFLVAINIIMSTVIISKAYQRSEAELVNDEAKHEI